MNQVDAFEPEGHAILHVVKFVFLVRLQLSEPHGLRETNARQVINQRSATDLGCFIVHDASPDIRQALVKLLRSVDIRVHARHLHIHNGGTFLKEGEDRRRRSHEGEEVMLFVNTETWCPGNN